MVEKEDPDISVGTAEQALSLKSDEILVGRVRTAWIEAERLVFDRPIWILLAVVAVLDLIKNGAWYVPDLSAWLAWSKVFPHNPHLPPLTSYILSSPIGPGLSHVLGLTSQSGYLTLHIGVIVAGLAVFVWGLHRNGGRTAVGVGVVALFASPLSSILVTWIGVEDPFLFLFTALALFFENPFVTAAAGIGLGLSNPEIAVFEMAVIVALVVADGRRDRIAALVGLVGGVFVGVTGCYLFDAHMGTGFTSRLTYPNFVGLHTLERFYVAEFPTLLFSVFGAWWLAVALLWDTPNRKARFVVTLSVVAAALITIVTLDETRIFALLTLPVLLWLSVQFAGKVPAAKLRFVVTWVFIAAIAMPRVVVQAGAVSVSTVHFLFGTPGS